MVGDTEGEASSSLPGGPTTELSPDGMRLYKMNGLMRLLTLKQIQIYSFNLSTLQDPLLISGSTEIYRKRQIKEKLLHR